MGGHQAIPTGITLSGSWRMRHVFADKQPAEKDMEGRT